MKKEGMVWNICVRTMSTNMVATIYSDKFFMQDSLGYTIYKDNKSYMNSMAKKLAKSVAKRLKEVDVVSANIYYESCSDEIAYVVTQMMTQLWYRGIRTDFIRDMSPVPSQIINHFKAEYMPKDVDDFHL